MFLIKRSASLGKVEKISQKTKFAIDILNWLVNGILIVVQVRKAKTYRDKNVKRSLCQLLIPLNYSAIQLVVIGRITAMDGLMKACLPHTNVVLISSQNGLGSTS
jgi:hypothetical protein